MVLAFIISVLVGCSAAPPSVKEEPAQSEAVSAPAPVVEPEPKETMPSVQQEPAKSAVPVKPAEPKQEAPIRKEEPPAKAEESSVKPESVVTKKEPAAKVKPAPAEKKQEVIAEFEGVTITKETEMEKIVENLNRITASKDYSQWLKLLSEEYKQQYSQALTLQKVSEALPVKGIKLKSLRDYFTYVFVPSRQNVRVDDIKFVSPTRVDVIMKQANVSLLVYGLENIDGTWKLIPPKL